MRGMGWIMAYLLRFLEGEVTRCAKVGPWRDVARRARRLNSEAQKSGSPERYLVDSDDLVACIICRDRPVWSNRLLLDTLGPMPVSIYDVVDASSRSEAERRIADMSLATAVRKPVRLVYRRPDGGTVAIVWRVVDQWEAGGDVFQASVGSVEASPGATCRLYCVTVPSLQTPTYGPTTAIEARAYALRWNRTAIRLGEPLAVVQIARP